MADDQLETRHQRALRDARGWTLTRREFVVSLALGVSALLVQAILNRGFSWTAALVSVGTVLATVVLLPCAVYAFSWLTAVSRIHRDALVELRAQRRGSMDTTLVAPPVATVTPIARPLEIDLSVKATSPRVVYVVVDNNPGGDADFAAKIERITGCQESLSYRDMYVKWRFSKDVFLPIHVADSAQLELLEYIGTEESPFTFRLPGPLGQESIVTLANRERNERAHMVIYLMVVASGYPSSTPIKVAVAVKADSAGGYSLIAGETA